MTDESPLDRLAVTCRTCKASAGQPCNYRGPERPGGPFHVARTDKAIWTRNKAFLAASRVRAPLRKETSDDRS